VLVFLRGHRELIPGAQEEFSVQSAKPNETVEISAEISTPSAPGRYTAFFRLADSERNMFGPRMWVDLIIPGESTSTAETGKSPKPGKVAKEEARALKVAAKEEAKVLKEAAKEIKKELKQVAKDSKMAFGLAKKEIKRAKQPNLTDGETEEAKDEDFYDSGEGEAQSVSVADSVSTSASTPPASSPPLDTPKSPAKFVSKWPIQMTALHNMGFDNEELNEFLLDKEKGNVQTVCNWLLEKMR